MSYRERNNKSRNNNYEKSIEAKYALDYELYSIKYHSEKYNHTTWHWRNIPEEELENAGWITDYNKHRLKRLEKRTTGLHVIREYGLDGLSLDKDGNYHGIQAKFWKSRNLTAHDLGTFFSVMFSRFIQKNNKSIGYLYHTCGLQIDVKDDIKNNPNLENCRLEFNPVRDIIKDATDIDETQYKLYPPQIEALRHLDEDWENAGQLSMPCGLGKTTILGHYLKNKNYKHIIIASPLRVQTKQMLDRIEKFIPAYYSLLVDSDVGGTTDSDYIFEMIDKNQCLISITYDSLENLFSDKIYDLEDTILIIDEAHNLMSSNGLIDIIETFSKSLLITATPSITMSEDITSSEIFYYPMREAINNKYICDYSINVPILDLKENVVDIDVPPELKDLDNDLTLKSLFLISGMLQTGSSRCIVYCTSIEECDAFNNIFTKICNEYHGLTCWTNSITANTNSKDRTSILNDFEYDNESNFNILSSVRILNEAVNIIKCDSVFITKINKNEITAVQRICRANRIDENNPNKKANCFIWSDDLNNVVNMFQMLKDNDDKYFFDKIKSISSNYDNKIKGSKEDVKRINFDKTLREYIEIKSVSLEERWCMRLDEVKKYIDEHKRKPSRSDKNTETLGAWINSQRMNYKKQKKKYGSYEK